MSDTNTAATPSEAAGASTAMLDLDAVRRALGDAAACFDIVQLSQCDSSNAELLRRGAAGAASGSVIVAAEQSAGRGRQQRSWFAAPGDSLTFSLLWRFAPETAPAGLSLAVGLAVIRALDQFAIGDTALKWPNDILLDAKKLAGVLIELLPGDIHAAVIGIGLNLRLPATLPAELRPYCAALNIPLAPERLLAAMLLSLQQVLEIFARGGFAALRDDWRARHAYENMPVQLLADFSAPRTGICRGVAADGALLLETATGVERMLSGELSLRPA